MERPLLITASYAPAELDALDCFFGLFMGETALTHETGRIAFASGPELIQKLEEIAAGRLRQAIAFVHLPPSHQNPFSVGKFQNLDGLATELVLSFPEVQFVFLGVAPKVTEAHQVVSEFALADRSSLPRRLELLARHSSGWLPIFDPSGLRAHLLSEMNSLDQRLQPALFDPFVQSRIERLAFVADEETSWAFMNGYLAYKAGFRAALLTTRAEFLRHVKPVRRADCGLILADLDLQFPDDTGERLMKKGQQAQELFLLHEIEWEADAHGAPVAVPIYLITGCKDLLTQDLCNHLLLLEDVKDAKIEHCRSKPYPGLFSILTPGGTTAIRVLADNFKALNDVLAKRQKAPPAKPEEAPGGYRHTAPYRRLRIANRLLRRAAMLGARECKNPQDLVHAALLATEAKEILGGMSRTTYFEAVAMQNEYETQAELAFFGSAANVEARSRLDRMRDELRYASPHSSGRATTDVERAIYNCSLQIIGNLRTLYSRAEQVDGAEECLRQVARDEAALGRIEAEAHRSEPRYRRIKAWMRRRGLAYVDAVTDSGTSLTRLAVFNLTYILAFGLFFAGVLKIAHIDEDPESKHDNIHPTHLVGRAFSHSFFTFVQVAPGPPRMDALVSEDKLHDKPGWKQACYWTYLSGVFAEMAVAYVHLGLLIAMLYRRLTRHAP